MSGFSRRFFREMFSRLPDGAALVLDNYQEVSPEQSFHQLIAQAIDEVPEGMLLIAVSRRDPPDCYARLIVNEIAALVDWEALKLTVEEARYIAVERHNSLRTRLADFTRKAAAGRRGSLCCWRTQSAKAMRLPASIKFSITLRLRSSIAYRSGFSVFWRAQHSCRGLRCRLR